jgi:hypothetical protein
MGSGEDDDSVGGAEVREGEEESEDGDVDGRDEEDDEGCSVEGSSPVPKRDVCAISNEVRISGV